MINALARTFARTWAFEHHAPILRIALWFAVACVTATPAHAAIAFRAASSASVQTGDPTITRPTGTAANDVMIAALEMRPASTTVVPPTGWILIYRADNTNSTDNSLAVYYKLAGPAEPPTYLWDLTNTNSGAAVGIASYSGADATNPIDVFAGTITPNGFEHAAPSITPTKNGAMIVSWHGYSSSNLWTPPVGMTEAVDISSDAAGTQYGVSLSGNYLLQATAAPTGALTATVVNDGTVDVGNAVAVALRNGNVAPTATNLSTAETYSEDIPLDLVDIVVTDPDSSVTATLTLSAITAGTLSTATSGAVTSVYNAGTGVWTASGPVANVNTLLAGVAFTSALNTSMNFTVATSVTDGVAPAVTGTKSFLGVAVNDAPTATNLSAAETYTEDTPLNLVDIVAADIDSATVTATLTLSSAAAGALTTATSGAVTSTYAAGTGVWTASGTTVNVNVLLAGVTFTPAVNGNSNFTIATSVSDGVAVVTGTKAITGTAVNDAPTATNLSAAETYTEDTALNLVDIVVSDIDSASVTVTLALSTPSAGSLSTATSGAVTSTYVAGTGVWTAAGAIASVNTLLAGVVFTPAANSSASLTIATSVSDGVAAAVTGSKAVTGTAVNDAPTASNLSAAETYTEDTALNLVDIVAADIDSANVTVTLTLSSPTAGSLSTATSGAVTSTYVAGTGVWTASGAIASVNTLLAGVTFTPAGNGNASVTIAVSVNDGVAAAVTGTKAITGTAVNDAPTATNLSAAETYTEDTALNLVDLVAADIDSATVTVALTLSSPTAGSLSTATSGAVTSTYVSGTGVWTASGAIASVNTLLAGVVFTPAANSSASLTIATSVSDGVAAAVTGSKAITGTAVNDAPTATNLSAAETYTEDTALNLVDIVAADIDSATLTVTLTLSTPAAGSLSTATSGAVTSTYVAGTGVWTASGALASVNTLLAGVTFTPAGNGNTSFTIAVSVTDGVAAAITGTKAITGTAVNDAPTATNLSAAETYTEDTALDLVDIVVSDIDSGAVTVTLALSAPTAGTLSTATSGAVTSTYVSGTGVWTASGAIASVNTLLAGVTFTPAANSSASVTIATSVSDGVAAAVTGTKAITGTAVNDAPTATNVSAAQTYTEDTALDLVDIATADIDSATLTVTLTLSSPAAGALSTATSGAVTSTYSAGTGVWTAAGAIANVNALLAGVTFSPAPNGNASVTIATSVSDGVAAAITGAKAITGTAVNDAPTATNLSAGETYTEGVALNLIDIVTADVDSATVTVTLTLSNPAAGALSTATSGAVTSTYTAGTGVWTASGAIGSVNTLLAGVIFTPATNFNASVTIATSVSDGVAAAVTGTKVISGSAVNDPPTASNVSAAETYIEDTALDLVNIVVTDVDSATVTVTLTLSSPTAGTLSTATAGSVTSNYAAGTGVWTASGAITNVNTLLAGLTFTPAANGNASFTIGTSVSDGVAAAITGTKAVTGTAVNDAPTATNVSAAETYTEDTALNLVDVVVADIDTATVTVTLTVSSPAAGTLSTATSGAVTSTYAAGTGVWTASGAIANVNALLAGVTFTPDPNGNSSFTIVASVSDGVAAAVTGSKAITGVAVNDAPTATNLSAAETYTEDTALNLVDIVTSDIDSGTVTATLTLSNPAVGALSTATSGSVTSSYSAGTGVWSASGPVADVNVLLAGLTFTPTANGNASFTIATSVVDGVAAAVTGNKAFAGTAVNDPPTATNLSATETYTEDTALNLTDIVTADADSAVVTVTLTLSNPAAGALSTATSGAVTSIYLAGTGVWTASGAIADVNTILAGVSFLPTPNFNSAVGIATSVSDGVAAATTGNKIVSGLQVNDPPTATNLSAAETYTEDAPADLVDITVTDIDSGTLTVTLTLSNPAAGGLSTATSGAVTSTYSAGTGVWTASGATGDLNLLLAGVVFSPAPGFNAGFTVVTSVSDGVAAPIIGNKVVTGIGVNDAPSATNLSAGEAYTEDIALNLVDIVVSDSDSTVVTASLTLSDPAVGTLSTATSGITTSLYLAGQGVWSATGAVADVNTLLAGVTFTPAPNHNGPFTVVTSVTDGASAPVTGNKAVSGIPVNDAPVATNLSAPDTYTEDGVVDLVDIVVTDPDSAVNVTLTLSDPAAGSLSTSMAGSVVSTYDTGSGVWTAYGPVAEVNTLLAEVVFTPAANANGSVTVATSVSDGVAVPATGSKTLTGIAVNDAPTATNLSAAETYTEDTTLDLIDVVVTDIDNATVTVTVTSSSGEAGSFSTATSGAVTASYDPVSATWTATGPIADVNALLAGLTFVPTTNGSAAITMVVTVSDGVALASGTKPVTGIPVTDCTPATCGNAGTCQDVATGFACACADGFGGTTCGTNFDDCVGNPCQHGGTCVDGAAAYTCECVGGFGGPSCETNLDDCSPNPCANGGTCTDGDASFTCECTTGFEGATCQTNIDDCKADPCLNGGACTDGVASYTCVCVPGFMGDTCGTNIDNCVTNPCVNDGACVDGVDTFTCECPNGYTGGLCDEDVDECTANPCENGGECNNGVGTFACTCAAGFNGATCETDVDDCESVPCQNGGTCADEVNGFTCTCADGFAGVTCTSDIFDCASNPCQNDATCTDTQDGRTCVCEPGYNGESCEFDIDDCDPSPCQNGAACTDAVNGFVCACDQGYSGTTCENFDECEASPCGNGGTCVDGPSAFTCVCARGFDGEKCENEIDECATSPCLNGGQCADGVGDFTCTCAAGYEGATCGSVVDVCATGNGGCDPSTTCTSTASGPVCGACPEGTSGTGESGCLAVNGTVVSVGADDSSGCVAAQTGRSPDRTPWIAFGLLSGLVVASWFGRRVRRANGLDRRGDG